MQPFLEAPTKSQFTKQWIHIYRKTILTNSASLKLQFLSKATIETCQIHQARFARATLSKLNLNTAVETLMHA